MQWKNSPWIKVIFICSLVIWAGIIAFLFHPGESRQAREQEKKGDVLFQKGARDQAVLCWRRAITLSPKRPSPYEKISAYYLLEARWPEARSVLEDGLTQLPSCVNLYFNLGLSYYFSGDYTRAKENFERVVRLNSYYPDAHYFLGLIYRKENLPDEEKKEFIREVNLNPASRGAWSEIRKREKPSNAK